MIAENSLRQLLQECSLKGKSFLDVGSGSGLLSLAARNLGARVCSFDFDPESVECTRILKARFYPGDSNWDIFEGSILDQAFLASIGTFDIVYSWGVLHHTGNMWQAMRNLTGLVERNGSICLAIYNDQGLKSIWWGKIKKFYCSNSIGKAFVTLMTFPYLVGGTLLLSIINKQNVFSKYKTHRGMSIIHDWTDWIGGYPFEVATVDSIFEFFAVNKFVLKKIKTTRGVGNNEFVFQKIP
jgi:2-polyprenyl-6-hydroxyphenyl methylase/3-demethylubiquinone-9 3-methyltransferase